MSHTVHPYSHRIGILRDWKSRWFVGDGKYQEYLKGDIMVRELLEKKLRGFAVDSIEMERGSNTLRIIIKTARPGMIIGRNGEGAIRLKELILKHMRKYIKVPIPKEVKLDIEEIRVPESHSALMGQALAEGLEKRLPFMKVMKQGLEKIMACKDVVGAKITMSGRLGGADMSRIETVKSGRLPLQTLRADIDFAKEKAHLPYGDIGIKVWIYKGDIFEKAKKR